MSSRRVKNVSNTVLNVASASWATGVLTIETTVAHNLGTGDVFNLIDSAVPQNYVGLVAATASGTTITVTMANKPDTVPGANAKIDFNYYKTTGTKTAFTIAKSDASSAVFQSYVKGTGGATYQLEVSLDGSHWVNLGSSQVHTGSNDHTLAQTIEPNWVYGRLNISVLGASTKIYALLSS